MRTGLKIEDVEDLLEEPIIAVLATRRRDDTVMLSPVWFEWREGGINVWVDPPESGKVRHVKRDPRASIVVANAEWPYRGIELRGRATVSAQGFHDVLGRTARRYFGERRGAAMAAGYVTPGVVIRLVPDEIRAWDYAEER